MNNSNISQHHLHQLPAQMNATIGRTQEIANTVSLLRQQTTRLLTLTGPGGVGKTRLALEIAKELLPDFKDGVFFVPLAPLREPGLVLVAIAQALAITDISLPSLFEHLQAFLRDKQLLLLLDNFEHVLDACPQLADLLSTAPHLKILVTSREVLHLYGEHEYAVLPLALPNLTQPLPDLSAPLPAAIALFVERARSVKPSFALTQENLHCVAEICVHLDGLPLAIELAAARCKLLPPPALLNRLQSRLRLLTGGARNLPARQQTLRNTLDWSYQLLSEAEQHFFCRLGVLTGNWTIEAASAVALRSAEEGGAFDLLASLVDKSLVRPLHELSDEPRFMLLETIREYALDNLEQRGELDETQRRHALFYIEFAEQAAPHFTGSDQRIWLQRVDRESANIALAMRWVIAQHEAQLALRLASALMGLQMRSSLGELRSWLEEVLTLPGTEQPSVQRARVAYGAAMLAHMQNNLFQALSHLQESQRIAEQVGDKRILSLSLGLRSLIMPEQGSYDKAYLQSLAGLHALDGTDDIWARGLAHSICGIAASRKCDFLQAQVHYKVSLSLLRQAGDLHREADALVNVGNMTRWRGKLITAHFLYQKALTLYQSIDDRWGQIVCLNGIGDVQRLQGQFAEAQETYHSCLSLATFLGISRERITVLWGLGHIALYQRDFQRASRYLKECLRISREIECLPGIIYSLQYLADMEISHSHWEDAQSYYEQSQALVRTLGDKVLMVSNLCGLGRIALAHKSYPRASVLFRQAIQLSWDTGDMLGLATALGAFARLCAHIGLCERAAQFLGSADILRESLNATRSIIYHGEYDRDVALLKDTMGEEAFHENWMVGQTMTLQHTLGMLAQIHIADESHHAPKKPATTYPAGLTAREVDVLRLVAQGLTDVNIAKNLILSPRTVNTHLRSIYAKLGISSRSAATRLAMEYKIV
jgi:predicted ATPase/DNA-binding CsgD family transcriptional regulator